MITTIFLFIVWMDRYWSLNNMVEEFDFLDICKGKSVIWGYRQ
jgi:hypothetical protein